MKAAAKKTPAKKAAAEAERRLAQEGLRTTVQRIPERRPDPGRECLTMSTITTEQRDLLEAIQIGPVWPALAAGDRADGIRDRLGQGEDRDRGRERQVPAGLGADRG